jgi:hypothetical protein
MFNLKENSISCCLSEELWLNVVVTDTVNISTIAKYRIY